MTIPQIIILTILLLLMIIGFFGSGLSKKEHSRALYTILLFFSAGLIAFIAVIMTSEREALLKQLKNKCPEYEKVENVYKLKQ